jgi:hypothetical protein
MQENLGQDSNCEADIGVDDEGLDAVKCRVAPTVVSHHRWKAARRGLDG